MGAEKSPQPALREQLSAATDLNADAFRLAQIAAVHEQRFYGNRWLVTDLVTVGSPLTHGLMHRGFNCRAYDVGERRLRLDGAGVPDQVEVAT